jgi:hypothetical protein
MKEILLNYFKSECVILSNADIINYTVCATHALYFDLCYTATYFSHDVGLTSDRSYNITKGIKKIQGRIF